MFERHPMRCYANDHETSMSIITPSLDSGALFQTMFPGMIRLLLQEETLKNEFFMFSTNKFCQNKLYRIDPQTDAKMSSFFPISSRLFQLPKNATNLENTIEIKKARQAISLFTSLDLKLCLHWLLQQSSEVARHKIKCYIEIASMTF